MADRAVASGKRDKWITIQRSTKSVGASRRPVETWNDYVSLWASRSETSGREAFKENQLSASADMRWEVPYKADWDPDGVDVPQTFRVLYRGRAYDITSAHQVQRQRTVAFLTLSKSAVSV